MEGNLTVESDYREMMKRWLYDFLFEKVIIHAKYLNPVQFSCGLITHPRGRKRKNASLPNPVQSHFQPKKDENGFKISNSHVSCRALWIAN
jgi:hypothetical protein